MSISIWVGGFMSRMAPPSGNWILTTGFWDDTGVWDDSANWID